MSLAADLFDATVRMTLAEDRVTEALIALVGIENWDDFTSDYYDESIEIYGCKFVLADAEKENAISDEIAAGIGAMGFARAWIHPHEKDERYPKGCLCRSIVLPQVKSK
jgi:hypothetical protein